MSHDGSYDTNPVVARFNFRVAGNADGQTVYSSEQAPTVFKYIGCICTQLLIMASWGAYLLGKKAETAPVPNISQPEDILKRFAIKPFDPSSSYGGKTAEDVLADPISQSKDSARSTFTKGSRRTQSDTVPIPQPQAMMPKRAQSNASRVARLFGYGAPVQDRPQPEEQVSVEPANFGSRNVEIQPIALVQNIIEQDKSAVRPIMGLRDVVKAVTQPKMLKIVDEAVEKEEERVFLEYEKKSEQIRIERDAMEAEKMKMFQAQVRKSSLPYECLTSCCETFRFHDLLSTD